MKAKLTPNVTQKQKARGRMRMRMIIVAASFAFLAVAGSLIVFFNIADIEKVMGKAVVTAVTTGNWGDDATWDTGLKPVSTDNVVIPSGYNVTANSDWTCASLTINAPSSNGASQLTVSDGITVTVTGNVDLNGGTSNSRDANLVLSGTGTFTVSGNFTLNATSNQKATVDMSTGASTINFGGNFSYPDKGTWLAGTASILNFNGTAAQTMPFSSGLKFYHIYCNNTSASGVTTDANISKVQGDLRVQSGTFNNGGYSVEGKGTFETANGAKTILTGSTSLPSGFATLTLGTNSTVQYDGNGAQTIGSAKYGNLTSTNTGDRTLSSSDTIAIAGTFTPGFNSYTLTGSTIDYTSASSQTIKTFNYFNLTSTGSGTRALPSLGTVRCAGIFSPGTSTWTVTGSTFEYNGTTGMNGQTITAFDYNNLKSGGTSNRTLPSTGTVGIIGTFTPGTNSYIITGSTIEFKSNSAQTIPAFNYNNLTSSGSGTRTLASSGTIEIASTFTPGGNTYTTTGSTVNFNGTTTQVIPAFSFNSVNITNTEGVSLSGDITLPGDMTISGTLNGSGGIITLKGDWTNNGTYNHGSEDVVLSGTSAQALGGSSSTTFYNLKVDNSSGVTLNTPATMEGVLTLTSGKVTTTSTNLLTFDVSATVTGGSASTFINGPAVKNTNSTSAFTFPIGKNSTYRQLGIEPDNANNTTFTAEYFDDTAATYNTNSTGPGINNVSTWERYQLDRSGAGAKANAKVTLYWDEISSVRNLSDLRVSRWDGTQWNDEGNTAYSGDTTYGFVTSGVITNFSPFTLGSAAGNNPLPIELLSFNAEVIGSAVKLTWESASEINNDFYTIERSPDGVNYEIVTTVQGAGNSNSKLDYSATDENPIVGTSYYKLKQTDYDGQFEYFAPVVVTFGESSNAKIVSVGPNPFNNYLNIEYSSNNNEPVELIIMNTSGQIVHKSSIDGTKGTNKFRFDETTKLIKGLYIINLVINGKVQSYKVLKS